MENFNKLEESCSKFNPYNNDLVKKLRGKIQKQEIDIRFLNEKIKRLENELKSSFYNKGEKNIEKNSKLSEYEVRIDYII